MAICSTITVSAQEKLGEWYIGLSEGIHISTINFSEVKDNVYDSKKCLTAPIISIFAQGEFGAKHQYAIRPELSYTRRGGKLKDFILGSYIDELGDEYKETADYSLKSHYIDFRLSLIYNFLEKSSKFRPYVFVTPRIGFATGGEVKLEQEDNSIRESIGTDLSDANISGTYFSLAPGAGIRWNFHTGNQGQHTCWLGVEASYEFGLSDTYSSKEKDHKVTDMLGNQKYNIEGTRKFSGFELKAVLGVPLSVFSKSKSGINTPIEETVTPVVVEEPKIEKSCYTLEEIIDMMSKNIDVKGKTICAVDAINFDFNKSTIKSESYTYLNKLAETLKRTNARIQVKGHTDNIGSDEVNMNLSRERAQAVVNYLLNKGVNRSKLSYDYFGATMPLTTNDTEEGRTMNRRVEFEIMK